MKSANQDYLQSITGMKGKIKILKKYKKLTNKEIFPSNPPLISFTRRGMVTSKNPFYTLPIQ